MGRALNGLELNRVIDITFLDTPLARGTTPPLPPSRLAQNPALMTTDRPGPIDDALLERKSVSVQLHGKAKQKCVALGQVRYRKLRNPAELDCHPRFIGSHYVNGYGAGAPGTTLEPMQLIG